jgi:hypothetical protein
MSVVKYLKCTPTLPSTSRSSIIVFTTEFCCMLLELWSTEVLYKSIGGHVIHRTPIDHDNILLFQFAKKVEFYCCMSHTAYSGPVVGVVYCALVVNCKFHSFLTFNPMDSKMRIADSMAWTHSTPLLNSASVTDNVVACCTFDFSAIGAFCKTLHDLQYSSMCHGMACNLRRHILLC